MTVQILAPSQNGPALVAHQSRNQLPVIQEMALSVQTVHVLLLIP